ncbi:MAG: hypothetical protein K8S16_08755 [Bacteroidales bacterium]|nr:hypothetical protein [Bacteroidales bacterium]
MKTLTLHINDNIYEDVKRFLALFSSKKLRIEEHISNLSQNTAKFTYDEFEKKWAGLLQNHEVKENWKDERIDHLHKKYL